MAHYEEWLKRHSGYIERDLRCALDHEQRGKVEWGDWWRERYHAACVQARGEAMMHARYARARNERDMVATWVSVARSMHRKGMGWWTVGREGYALPIREYPPTNYGYAVEGNVAEQ